MRFLKKKLIAIGSLAAAAVLLLLLNGVSILFTGGLQAVRLSDEALEHAFLDDQQPHALDLSLTVAESGHLKSEARFDITIDPDSRALYFLLNADLHVTDIEWEGRSLRSINQIGPLWRASLDGVEERSGRGSLLIAYRGALDPPGASSIFTSELIYLDPADAYYPRLGSGPVDVMVRATWPTGFVPICDSAGVDAMSARTFAYALPKPASTFAVAGCRAQPARTVAGGTALSTFSLGERPTISRETLAELCAFFGDRLPALRPEAMSFVSTPANLVARMRCDGSGIVLFPEDLRIDDLAYGFALLWLGAEMPRSALFSRDEMAKGWSLYFIARKRRLEKTYTACLEKIDITRPGASPLPPSELSALLFGGLRDVGRNPGYGGFLLSVLRRMVGDAAFDRVCREALETGLADGAFWSAACGSALGREHGWFFDGLARERRTLDLAVREFTVRPVEQRRGYQVRIVLGNEGDIELPERVQVVLLTEERWIAKRLVISRSGTAWDDSPPYIEEEVVGVLIDPDYEWPDADRGNNVAFLDSCPFLVSPSADNRFLAGAFWREAGSDKVPLVIEDLKTGSRRIYHMQPPIGDLTWLDSGGLLVRVGEAGQGERSALRASDYYLVDPRVGGVRHLGCNALISPSPSGRFLVLNERSGNRWRHRLIDLREGINQPLLNRIDYRLEFIDGTDLLRVVHPRHAARNLSLYDTEGECVYTGIETGDEELFGFRGHAGGIYFLGREGDRVHFYHLPAQDVQSSPSGRVVDILRLFSFDARDVRYRLDRSAGYIYFFESLVPPQTFRISRYDLDHLFQGGVEYLFEGDTGTAEPLLTSKGLVKVEGGGNRIIFHSFDDRSEVVIAEDAHPLQVLGLVGEPGGKCLYFVREEPLYNIPGRLAGLPPYTRRRLMRYEFRSGAVEDVAFGRQED